MSNKIPKSIKDFILEYIDSVADLEGLLILRENPGIYWDAHALAERLYIEEMEAADVLRRLHAAGFLSLDPDTPKKYCYRPQSEALSDQVDAVAAIYTRSLVPLTNLIHSKPKTRIQEFADAFRIRKDP